MATMNESIFNTPKSQRLMAKYGKRLGLAESLRKERGLEMGYERKLATAITLENTARQIKVMEAMNFGATQPSNIGQYKRFALDMVGTVMPNLIAPDLVSVQAIDNRVGMINVLQFQYGSNKGTAENGRTFASPLAYEGTEMNYTSNVVADEIVTTDSEGKYRLAYTPIRPGTVSVIDANGAPVSEGALGLDYTTGVCENITEEGFRATYRYDNETVPVQAPQLKMDIKSLPITTQSRKLTAVWAFDAAYELQKEYGQDMQTLLATQATAEIQAEIDREITTDLKRAANAGPEVVWSRIQPYGVSASEHYDSFWNKVVEGSNQIFAATKRVRANFMICGLGVDSVLKCMRSFEASEDTSAIGPHFIGTLGGIIKCYVDPNYDANEFVLGYKGTTLMDTGYVYAPYMPIMTTDMVTLDDFASRQGWATMYGKKMINPRMYLRGRIDG